MQKCRTSGTRLASLALILLCCLQVTVAADSAKIANGIYFGFEWIELRQNDFRDLGRNNYTAFLGASFGINKKTSWGLHYTGMQVQLSEEHLQEPSPAYGGNFSGVSGALNVQRLYLDYFYHWNLAFLEIRPVLSFGLGYNRWYFYHDLLEEEYDLQTFSAGISGRFRFTFFDYVFVEIPAADLFFHLYKNRPAEAYLGDAHIAFNEYFGIFNWIFIGCSISL